MANIELRYDYAKTSPHELFAALADPKTIERIAPFRTKVTRVRAGAGHQDGAGSVLCKRGEDWRNLGVHRQVEDQQAQPERTGGRFLLL